MCFVTAEADLVSASRLHLHFKKAPERISVPLVLLPLWLQRCIKDVIPLPKQTLHPKWTRHELLKIPTDSVQHMHVSQLMAQREKKVGEDDVALLLSRQPVMTSGSKLWIIPDVEI